MPVTKSIQSHQAAAGRALLKAVYNDARWSGPGGCRELVIERDPICRACGQHPSTIADHWPTPLRQLLASGADPFNPQACRGVCHPCSGASDGGRLKGGVA